MQTTVTKKEQIKAGINTVVAVSEAIRELKQVPSGHLYAQVMGFLDEAAYQKVISILKNAGLVAEQNFMLTWTGPAMEGGAS